MSLFGTSAFGGRLSCLLRELAYEIRSRFIVEALSDFSYGK